MATERIISDRIISGPGAEGYYAPAATQYIAPATTQYIAPAATTQYVGAPAYVQPAPTVIRSAAPVLDQLKTFQVGAASEIYSLFEERSKQLDAALARIRELETSYVQNQNILKDKDSEIHNLRGHIHGAQNTKKSHEAQISGVAGEVQRLQAGIHEAQSAHRNANEDKLRLENDIRVSYEHARALEVEINRHKAAAQELEDRFTQLSQQQMNELSALKSNVDQIKAVNSQHASIAKDREGEVLNLRGAMAQLAQLQLALQAKDQQVLASRGQLEQLTRIADEHCGLSGQRDAEILKLEDELKDTRNRFVNAKRANQILLKKVITLSEDVETPEDEDVESDDELNNVREELQKRMDTLRGLFPTQTIPQQQPVPQARVGANPPAPVSRPVAAVAPAPVPVGPRPAGPAPTAPVAAPRSAPVPVGPAPVAAPRPAAPVAPAPAPAPAK